MLSHFGFPVHQPWQQQVACGAELGVWQSQILALKETPSRDFAGEMPLHLRESATVASTSSRDQARSESGEHPTPF